MIKVYNKSISHQSTLVIETNSYVYFENKWTKENGLGMKKYDHRSIVIGGSVYHIGGGSSWGGTPKYIEKWTITNFGFEKETKQLIDENSIWKPEVFMVPADYCNLGKSEKL